MATSAKCSICGKAAHDKFKPFCSSRCATIDLGRWLGESYRAASEEEPEGDMFVPGGDNENTH